MSGPRDPFGGDGDEPGNDGPYGDAGGRPSHAGELIVLPGVAPPEPAETPEETVDDTGFEHLDDARLAAPPPHMLTGAVEALLLAADGPVTTRQLDAWLQNPGEGSVHRALTELRDTLSQRRGGMCLVAVAKGWQLRTDPVYAPWVAAMRGARPLKLSSAALETLAIVAYRQPVTRGEVEDLRGVNPGGVLRMLCERGLVSVVGRKEEPGRPLLYGTSPEFLALFGLRDLSELPTLRDLRELRQDDDRLGVGGTDFDDSDLDGDGFFDDDDDLVGDANLRALRDGPETPAVQEPLPLARPPETPAPPTVFDRPPGEIPVDRGEDAPVFGFPPPVDE